MMLVQNRPADMANNLRMHFQKRAKLLRPEFGQEVCAVQVEGVRKFCRNILIENRVKELETPVRQILQTFPNLNQSFSAELGLAKVGKAVTVVRDEQLGIIDQHGAKTDRQ
jgi:hypothetical protein